MRWLGILALCVALLHGTSDTVKRIDRSKKSLSAVKGKKKRTSRRLEKIAKDIKKTEQELKQIEKKLEILARDENRTEERYKKLKAELREAQRDLEVTLAKLERTQKKFIGLLSERFSILFAMQRRHEPTRQSILEEESYQAYKSYNQSRLATLQQEMEALKKEKKSKQYRRNKTEKELARLAKRKKNYEEQKRKKQTLLKRLSADEEKYTAKLQKIIDRQNELQATLAKLNILRKKEVEEARRRAKARREAIRKERERKRRLRLARARAKKAREALRRARTKAEKAAAEKAVKAAEEETTKIGKIGEAIHSLNASYKSEKVYRYKGKKTISPLPGAKVVKRFGTYIDPIYKIKIFNKGITLQAPRSNAKVYNVMNGKVVFADETSMLGKVVVISHGNLLHTVYAGLSKISPFIKKNKRLKKGYVIGRVRRRLIFEVTKGTRLINPLAFIQL